MRRGDGVISFLGDTVGVTYTNINFDNNTISGLLSANGTCGISLGGGHPAVFSNLSIRNNLFHNCTANAPVCGSNGATCTGTTKIDANSFYSIGSGWGTNAQVTTGNPFASAGTNVAGTNNFRLSANTAAGTAISNVGSQTFNVDMIGKTRTTWSRGAYEF